MLDGNTLQAVKIMLKKALFAALLIPVFLCLGACSPEAEQPRKTLITVGMEATSVNSLIYIADEKNYFADNGVKVIINDGYPSGAAATEKMLQGDVDISTTAELGLVRYAFAQNSARTIGSIDMFMHMKLIGRKDLGIGNILDLAGKRIGLPTKTAADFELARFLDLNGIDKSEISIVDVQAPKAVEALTAGAVEAVVAWQPNVMTLKDLLGGGALVWDVQSGQPMYCLLITTNRWASENPDPLKRFMISLLRAEEYVTQNPDAAMDLMRNRLGYEDRYIRSIWREHQFSLRLDQSLILAMEDQARWMIENELTGETNVPNFLDYILEEPLKRANPSAINIIR